MEHKENTVEDCNKTIKIENFDRRISKRTSSSIIRFELDGAIYRSLAWNAFGFQTSINPENDVNEGDSLIIRKIGYGNLSMIPVMIRAEVSRKDFKSLSIKFTQNHRRDRMAFENFIARSKETEMAAHMT